MTTLVAIFIKIIVFLTLISGFTFSGTSHARRRDSGQTRTEAPGHRSTRSHRQRLRHLVLPCPLSALRLAPHLKVRILMSFYGDELRTITKTSYYPAGVFDKIKKKIFLDSRFIPRSGSNSWCWFPCWIRLHQTPQSQSSGTGKDNTLFFSSKHN